jgi:hypothetical protein
LQIYAKKSNICQDRLGTNIGKSTQNKTIAVFLQGFGAGNSSAKYYKTITTPKHFVGQIFEGGDMGNGTTMDRTRNDSRISAQVTTH